MLLHTLGTVFSVHGAARSPTPKTLTSVSSFWCSLLHRSLGCICNGRQSQHRALRPDSLLLAAWHRVCLEPLDTQSCSRPLGETTDRPPNTPTCHCHLRRGQGGQDFSSKGFQTIVGQRKVSVLNLGAEHTLQMFCFYILICITLTCVVLL